MTLISFSEICEWAKRDTAGMENASKAKPRAARGSETRRIVGSALQQAASKDLGLASIARRTG